MKKTIDFSDRAIELMKYIQEQTGQRTFSSTLHGCISGFYNLQYFNKRYMDEKGGKIKDVIEHKKEEEMTDEQYCESKGGKVNKISMTCVLPEGALKVSVPLTDRDGIDQLFESNIKIQNELNKKQVKSIRYE